MKRKPKLEPRNPLVAPSLFRKAGPHAKSNKAQRRADKTDLSRRVAQLDRAPGFYPVGFEFDPQLADHREPKRLAAQLFVCVFSQLNSGVAWTTH